MQMKMLLTQQPAIRYLSIDALKDGNIKYAQDYSHDCKSKKSKYIIFSL